MSKLFESIDLRQVTLPNRIVIAPMCEFSAQDGCASDWHMIHIGHLMLSGAGLMMIEATAVEPQGRITRECLGLYSDESEAALGRVIEVARKYSDMPVGVQLSHAGRKASTLAPWDGPGHVAPADGGWPVIGPSPLPFAEGWPVPEEMTRADMDRVLAAFEDAARRCVRLGVDVIELHGAHGYLVSSFLSPIANRRTDRYGGSLNNRMTFPLEVFEVLREAWPKDRPLGVRLNGTDWRDDGITPAEAVAFAQALARRSCDFFDVSSGGNGLGAKIPSGPGYQVPFATQVKEATGVPTMAVGLIRSPYHAEAIVATGQADMVAIGRGMLNDPRWPWHAAEILGHRIRVPPQYERAATQADIPSWGR